ncbi:hypothetical protein NQ176_g4119 [Zarea fungicola]|uniref:Uncharacterized protein n=1 Tax=Zarea fungicola TaxID=93591 RepID=A0ACC1NHK2_9HYPO|nr:hypothetical protein NQ176_g4119 [Lecanicillium fungicola]
MLDGTNFPIDPGTLVYQQVLSETDNVPSRATSTSSARRLSTPDTNLDELAHNADEEVEDCFTSRKPNTRARKASADKIPASKPKSKSKSTTNKTKSVAAGGSSSGGTTTSTASKSGGAMEKRRRQNQERNRTAASRCRQRKKQWQDGLERRRIELESRRKALHLETEELLEEVDHLKNFVMAHAACNDAKIDNWISNEADSFVRRISTANLHGQQPQPGLGDAESPLQNTSTGRPSMNDLMSNMSPLPGQNGLFHPSVPAGVAINDECIFTQDMLVVS